MLPLEVHVRLQLRSLDRARLPPGYPLPGAGGGDTAHGPEIQVSRMPALLGDAHVCKEKMAMTFFYVLIQRQGAHGSGGRGEGERESGVEREIMA